MNDSSQEEGLGEKILTDIRGAIEGRISEDDCHIIYKTLDGMGMGLDLADWQLEFWEHVDERFTKSMYGRVPYSPTLHHVIEGLVESRQLTRDEENPLILRYSGQ